MERVTAVVLNWNDYDETAGCLRSLQKQDHDDLSIVVVDNGSTDESGERLQNNWSDCRFVMLPENRGFSKGMNAGIREALDGGADYIWILNNDIRLKEATLSKLLGLIKQNSDVGMVSPVLKGDSGVKFRRGVIDHSTGLAGDTAEAEKTTGILLNNDFIPLACTLISADVFESVGHLPTDYFLYFEDAEFGDSVTNAGFELATCLDADVYHDEGSGGAALRRYYAARNRRLFSRRIGASWLTISYLSWLCMSGASALADGDYKSVKAVIEGFVDAAKNDFGRGRYP